jgi:hypothetical protein
VQEFGRGPLKCFSWACRILVLDNLGHSAIDRLRFEISLNGVI